MYCPKCGNEYEFVTCWNCDGEGQFDLYEEDPINESPGTFETCDECDGEGEIEYCHQCNEKRKVQHVFLRQRLADYIST